MEYKDRFQAGTVLGTHLREYASRDDVVVLAIPNGGVPVGMGIKRELDCEFGLLIIRKIQYPFTTESGFGAITSDGKVYINDDLLNRFNISPGSIERQVALAREKVEKRAKQFNIDRFSPEIKGKTVILTDDGIAAGSTMRLAISVVKGESPGKMIIAIPTAPAGSLEHLKPLVDEIICPDIKTSYPFAVANAYARWRDLTDAEVHEMLEEG